MGTMGITVDELRKSRDAYLQALDVCIKAQQRTRTVSLAVQGAGSAEQFRAVINAIYEEEQAEGRYQAARLVYQHKLYDRSYQR